jgi:murein DD-endopeptidase MepM/ murein hydrolase activator NlpD
MRIAKNLARTGLLAVTVLPAIAVHAAEAPHCTGGLQLRLSAPLASQGSLILAELRSPRPIKDVTGTWADRSVYFWKATNASSPHRGSNSDERQALLGVDLEKAPGTYELTVTSTTAIGENSECTASLLIRAGKFATESLKVDQQFVEPNEQQATRAAADQQKLRGIFDHVTPEKLWRGPFRMPLDGPAHGTNFGKRRVLNGQPRSPHTGADFPAPTGTRIHATQSGRVVLAEELYFSGNTVIIDHGLGVYSLYGHLSAIDVAVGDDLKVGAVLGKVGATGRVTGPHLHWGVTVNKARVNPVQLVTALRTPRN